MSESIDRGLARRLRRESDRAKDAPYPAGSVGARPNRARSWVGPVRLSDKEHALVQQLADEPRLPAATLVRSWIRSRLEQRHVTQPPGKRRRPHPRHLPGGDRSFTLLSARRSSDHA